MRREKANDLLNKVNEKSKKKWTFDEIKSFAKSYNKEDLKNEKNLTDLIENLARATGIKLTDEKMNRIKEKIAKFRLI